MQNQWTEIIERQVLLIKFLKAANIEKYEFMMKFLDRECEEINQLKERNLTLEKTNFRLQHQVIDLQEKLRQIRTGPVI
jgi:hypothetical protein